MKSPIRAEHVLGVLIVAPFVVAMNWGPSTAREVVCALRDPEIVESSGLVVQDGWLVTVNDSGDVGRVFVVDPETGQTIGTTTWGEQQDVEALAPGGDTYAGAFEVWVGDIGDNDAERESISVRPVPVDRGDHTLDAGSTYTLVYPDGPHDAEALLVVPATGRLLVATKEVLGGVLYAAPEQLNPEQPNPLQPVADVMGSVSDGAFFPSGRHLVLRNYGRATVYTWPEMRSIGSFRLPQQQQGEGIAVDESGEVYLSTEGQFSEILHLEVPMEIATELAPPSSSSPPSSPPPSSESAEPLPTTTAGDRPLWPWLLTGGVGVLLVVVLVRSLRPR